MLAVGAMLVVLLTTACGNNVAPPPGLGYGPGYGIPGPTCPHPGGESTRRDGQPYFADLAGSQGGSITLNMYYVNRLDDNFVQNVNATVTVTLPTLAQRVPGAPTTFCATTQSFGAGVVNAPGQYFRDQRVSITLKNQMMLPSQQMPMPYSPYSPYGAPGYGSPYGGYGQPQQPPSDVLVEIGKLESAGVGQARLQGSVGIRIGTVFGNAFQAQ